MPGGPADDLGNSHLIYSATNALAATASYYSTEAYALTGDRRGPWLLAKVVDPNGGVTTLSYDQYLRTNKIQRPEGNSITVTYDGRGNILTRTLAAKPTAPAANISEYANFPATCTTSTIKTCNKPIYMVDANGYRKNYSWYLTNGGLDTETDGLNSSGTCVISGGVCPQISQTYYPFSGIDNSALYLLVSKTQKIYATHSTTQAIYYKNTQTYPIAKTVDDSGGSNLTTCYSFDDVGNNISRTLPNAGLTVCP
jgi:YD repeat-containing protein